MLARVKYVLSNVDEYHGYYYRKESMLIDFKLIYESLGIKNLNAISMVVLTYDMIKRFNVHSYDAWSVEIDPTTHIISYSVLL